MTEIEYLQCPLCGWCKPLNYGKKQKDHGDKREVRFDNIDLNKAFIFQIRIGGGRGSGFYIDKERSFKLKDLDINRKKQLKKQCKKILKILK